MNEKALPVLEQYDFKIKGTKRVRGSYYCETDKGLMLLKEYDNSKGKLEILEKLANHLEECGMVTDRVFRNKEGELISQGPDGGFYILKKWYEHRESEPEDEDDIVKGAGALARLHTHTKDLRGVFSEEDIIPQGRDFRETFKKHNREILKVKRYVEKLKNKSDFEFDLKREIDIYYEQALLAEKSLNADEYEKLARKALENKTLCHGNSQYHNIIMVGEIPVIVNFIRININLQIYDLYIYLKKCMEKNDWDIALADKILEKYQKINSISNEEMEILKVLFVYPEKFWKIVNSYYNSNKAWLSEKNKEKLEKFRQQKNQREEFLVQFR